MNRKLSFRGFKQDSRAVSPAISTVIITSAIVVLLLSVMTFTNGFLNARMSENEFSTMKQLMQTIGLQIDDVAWTAGRTQTTRYASKFGEVNFESLALNYTVYVDTGSGYVLLANFVTGILMFNMPVNYYSVTNNYYEKIIPSANRAFVQVGTSAPVCHIFIVEKMPMMDGSFIRVVAAPSIRMLNSTITTGSETQNYVKFYLPMLAQGASPRSSQTVTLVSTSVSTNTESAVNRIKISISAPKSSLGFDLNFFDFDNIEEEIAAPSGSIIQFYIGGVTISQGLHL
jgi:hypothetical protein